MWLCARIVTPRAGGRMRSLRVSRRCSPPFHHASSRRGSVASMNAGLAVGAAPQRTVSHVWSPSSPIRLNKAARRPCRAAVCPPPRPAAAPASAGRPRRVGLRPCWGRRSVSRGPAALQTRRRPHARSFPARSRPPDSQPHPTPLQAMRRAPVLVAKAPAARRHVARRRACHGASFAARIRSPSVGR